MAPATYRFIADRFDVEAPAIRDRSAQRGFVKTLGRSLHSIQITFLGAFASGLLEVPDRPDHLDLGSAFSAFALPLLVFQLTHSPISLAIATFTFALPHLLFGLFIGAWVDRVDRKRLMIVVDILLALTVMLIIPATWPCCTC